MELYREDSQVSPGNQIYMYGALVLVLLCIGYEAHQTFSLNLFSIMGWGYSVLFLMLWVWRFMFSYTYILTDKEFIIITKGLGLKRTYSVDLSFTESYTNRYVHSFFKKTKISHYIHRYSSADSNPQRMLVFREGKKLAGVLFKSSDKFIKVLRKEMPDKFIGF